MPVYIFLFLFEIFVEPKKIEKVEQIYNVTEYYKLVTIMPNEDESPTDSSIIYFGYTPSEFVVYIKNWQRNISASSQRRDAEGLGNQQEDCVFIILGSNGKGKDGYMIGVNPLGTIYDCMISSTGLLEWDGNITAMAKKQSWGWDVLITIPFSSINYSNTLWAIQIMKVIFSKMEVQVLAKTRNPANLQDAGDLKIDLTYIKPTAKTNIFFIPSARIERSVNSGKIDIAEKFGFTGGIRKETGELGEVTVFPDYSEVDVDIQDFSLERLPINYPEKRPFFIEGGTYYQTPVKLIRTRNLTQPLYGLKFYSAGEKSTFVTYFLNDSAQKNVSFTRYAYTPVANFTIGSFATVAENDYNLVSGDIFYYLKSLGTNFNCQFSKNFSNLSKLSYIGFSRQEKPGLSLTGNYLDIDSAFISPLNSTTLYFDGIRKIDGAANINFSPRMNQQNIYINGTIKFSRMVDKYENTLLNQQNDYSFACGPIPILFLFSNNIAGLYYLGLENNNLRIYSIGTQYLGETWRSLLLMYSFGDYLGGKINQQFGEFKYSFFNKINIGVSLLKVKSNLDDFLLYQTYGEFSLLIKSLILKPYINYTKNYATDERILAINNVLLYEPKHMTGIYLAFTRRMKIESGYINNLYEKLVFKIQGGINYRF